jgi:GT2 family glycosyltransferase
MPLNENLKKLSILIVTYKGDELLSNCLKSLNRTCGNLPEIVVVDNSENISTKKIVSTYSSAKYISSKENLGFAGGNNLGLPHCTRPYILLLNNDTIIHEEPFSQLIDYLDEHNNVAVVQGKMRLALLGNILDDCGIMLTSTGGTFSPFSLLNANDTTTPSRAVHSVKGAMMMIRKSVINESIGILFHPHFHCNYEETDFCHRAWLNGYEVHYVNTVAIDHLQNQTISRFDKTEVFGKTLANQLFSLFTTLEAHNAIKMIFCQLSWHLTLSTYSLFKKNTQGFKILFVALKNFYSYKNLLFKTRKTIQLRRKISDKELFKKISVSPPLKYYYNSLKGNVVEYKKANIYKYT